MTDTTAVDVCVCTFRRPFVVDTLRSLAAQRLPDGVRIHVIVIDNDDGDGARAEIVDAGRALGLTLTYRHAPARNIALARNAGLDAATAPVVAMLDDDEIADPHWLAELLAVHRASGAEVVLGPVIARYAPDSPRWMREGDFHSTGPVFVNGRIITGYTCNVLLSARSAPLSGVRFRLELGRTGGEDTEFFDRVVRAGGTIAFAPNALVHEDVDPRRASLGWLMKRRFRSGQTHGLLLGGTRPGAPARLRSAAVAGGKFAFCVGGALATSPLPRRRAFWMLRAALHAGAVSRLAGMKTLVQYGADPVADPS